MSKNIEINYKNDAGYEELYPKTKTDVNYLSSAINTLYGFTGENSLDDALAQLFLGVGKYGYAIHVEYPDGSPAEGFTVTGLESPGVEETLITNVNGDVVGVSNNQTVSIGINSPYVDVENISNEAIISSGILTQHTVKLAFKDVFLLQESGKITFSSFVTKYDLCAVGGGGGGNIGASNVDPGSGGGGGYVSNLLEVSKETYPYLTINVGAGGKAEIYNSHQASNGGTTTVVYNEQQLLVANGGNMATKDRGDGIPGTGNGDGGTGYYDSTVNSSGRTNAKGKDGEGYIFEDSKLGLAGGGGGAGVVGSYNDTTGRTPVSGGSPHGATGGAYWEANSERLSKIAGVAGPGGGGGGGIRLEDCFPSDGGDGGVYIRCYYNDTL